MQFNSLAFLFLFLPGILLIYALVPEKFRNLVLVLGSALFYCLADDTGIAGPSVFCGLILLTFFGGKLVARWHKRILIPLVLLLVGLLLFFKLAGRRLFYPAGLSFFLFQMIAYLMDVNRNRLYPERNLISYACQISLFPKLLSGPIMDPLELQKQTWGRGYLSSDFRYGLHKLIMGLGMKVIVADHLGGLWAYVGVVGYDSISVPLAWVALISYAGKLFCDFAGYSLMAIGLGKMLGFTLPENFTDPYSAGSVSEFFRRWHRTLGLWFRNYVYIPLGGSRKGAFRTLLNLTIVWFLTGIWHGVGLKYLAWAGIILFFILNEKLWLGKILDRIGFLRHFYMVPVILLSWVPFATDSLSDAGMLYGKLFGLSGSSLNAMDFVQQLKIYGIFLALAVFLATPLPRKMAQKLKDSFVMDVVLFVVFWISVFFLTKSAGDTFMYYQF